MKDNGIKEKILDVVQSRMVNFGYRKVTMDEIASDLKMSKNTIYLYFESKEKIANELFLRLKDKIVRKQGKFKKELKDPLEVMTSTVSFLQKELASWFKYFLVDIQVELPSLWQEFVKFRTEQILALEALVRSAIKKGEFRSVNPAVAVQVYLGAIDNIIDPEFLDKEGIVFGDAIDMVMDIWSKGMKK